MKYWKALALSPVICLTACAPDVLTPQGRLSMNTWACPNNTSVTFSRDGEMATSFKSDGKTETRRSHYKIIEGIDGKSAILEFSDDQAVHPIFGGSTPLVSLEVSFMDFHLWIKTRGAGFQDACAPVKSPT